MASCKGSAFLHALLRCIFGLACAATALMPVTAAADSFSGFMEFDFAKTQVKSSAPAVATTSSNSELFLQRYNIGLTKNLFPLVSLAAGGVFENSKTDSSGSDNSSGSATDLSPFVNLAWLDRNFPVNLGYQRREDRSQSNGIASPTQIMESYNASLGWRPLELPPWTLQYLKTNQYDKERVINDSSSDSFQWGTAFQPFAGFDFAYQGSYLRDQDHLVMSESDFQNHNLRMNYADQFFGNRLSVANSYNVAVSTSNFSRSGQGVSLTPVLTTGTLFGITTPTSSLRVDSGTLPPNSSAFNINIVSAAPLAPGTQYNFGLDFGLPVTVSALYLPVVSGKFLQPLNLKAIVDLGLFPWTVYTSDDNITWTLGQTIATPLFKSDPIGASTTVGFVLNIVEPTPKRYIKVVVTPVQQSALLQFQSIADIDTSNISVAGLQAFSVPGQGQGAKTSRSLAGAYSLSASARILDNPNLNYDMTFSLNHGSSDGVASLGYYLSNGLTATQRFNEIFSAMARLSFNTNHPQGAPATNAVGASFALTASPLSSLSHSLVYSGQLGYSLGREVHSDSLFFNNTVQLYRGAALSLSSGFSASAEASGRSTDSTILNAGLSLSPNKAVSLDLGYGQTVSKSTGGELPDVSSDASSVSSSATYRPFEAVYFFGRWTLFKQQNQPTNTTQNYGTTWSPFAGGALQLNASYNEGVSLPDETRNRGVTCSLQWIIRPGVNLDAAYSISRTTSPTAGSTDVNSFSTVLRIAL